MQAVTQFNSIPKADILRFLLTGGGGYGEQEVWRQRNIAGRLYLGQVDQQHRHPHFLAGRLNYWRHGCATGLEQPAEGIAQLTGMFGILALILAAVGLYGVTAYAVERRTSEIGVRMAFGADRSNVIRLVLRGAFLQILIGLFIGIPITVGCSKLIANQLLYVKGWDPMVLGGAILALAAGAFLDSIIPARRAASINPVQALRTE